MTDSELPKGMALPPLNEAFKESPYESLDLLREKPPVFEDTDLKRYISTKHDDVKAILRDAEHWNDPRKANPGTFTSEFLDGNLDHEEAPPMLLMDEPRHHRLRSLVSSSFIPKAVKKWRPRTREIIQRVLSHIFEVHPYGEFDLIEEFAGAIPAVVIAEMLGIDPSMHANFKVWSETSVVSAFNPFATDVQKTAGEDAANKLNELFQVEISARRTDLRDDLISDMIRAEEAREKFTEIEMIRQANLLLIAGNVTNTDLIGNCVKALLDNPAQAQSLRNKPELIDNTIEETLRFDSPAIDSGRISSQEIEIGGYSVGKGQSLRTSLAAANHDPATYPNPKEFDIGRKDTHHQSFGGGRHLCLWANLARLEAQEAVLALINKPPNHQHSPKGYEHHAIPSFRGMSHFGVKG